jgi:putative flippase GtrA
MKLLDNSVVRFLVVGAINTLATAAIFVGLGLVIPPAVAYLIAFAIGLVWVVFGSSRFVFRAKSGLRNLVAFAVLYLIVFGCGQLVIRLLDPQGLPSLVLTSLAVIAVTTPLTYLGGRLIFRAAPDIAVAPETVAAEKEESTA